MWPGAFNVVKKNHCQVLFTVLYQLKIIRGWEFRAMKTTDWWNGKVQKTFARGIICGLVVSVLVIYIPLPFENSFKQLPKLDFFPHIVSVLLFPSTSLMKAEKTLWLFEKEMTHWSKLLYFSYQHNSLCLWQKFWLTINSRGQISLNPLSQNNNLTQFPRHQLHLVTPLQSVW